jgi:hypothetical protein
MSKQRDRSVNRTPVNPFEVLSNKDRIYNTLLRGHREGSQKELYTDLLRVIHEKATTGRNWFVCAIIRRLITGENMLDGLINRVAEYADENGIKHA